MKHLVTALLLVSTWIHVAYAQVTTSYCDPISSICYQGFTDKPNGVTFGFVFPPVTNPPANEYIVQMVSPVSYGWTGLSVGGSMQSSLLFTSWASAQHNVLGTRWTSTYTLPQLYTGPQLSLLPDSTINSTHIKATFRCQNCTTWRGGSVGSGDLNALQFIAYAFSKSSKPTHPEDVNSDFPMHDIYGYFALNLLSAHDANYFSHFGSSSSAPPPPTTTTTTTPPPTQPPTTTPPPPYTNSTSTPPPTQPPTTTTTPPPPSTNTTTTPPSRSTTTPPPPPPPSTNTTTTPPSRSTTIPPPPPPTNTTTTPPNTITTTPPPSTNTTTTLPNRSTTTLPPPLPPPTDTTTSPPITTIPPPTKPPSPTSSCGPSPTTKIPEPAPTWAQCGGMCWYGPFTCAAGTTCTKMDTEGYYYQCLPGSGGSATSKTPIRSTTASTTTTTAPPTQTTWGQCGGQNWTGPTACPPGVSCVILNQYYSQCQPTKVANLLGPKAATTAMPVAVDQVVLAR